jgi:mannose-6-phosphate isomerase-like protein (cupin superfamily)
MLTIKNKIEQSVLIKALPFKKNIRKTVPHKHHNYFEIIYLSEGTGTHTMDYQTYDIQPSTLFLCTEIRYIIGILPLNLKAL